MTSYNLGYKHLRHKKETKDQESQRRSTASGDTEAVIPAQTTVVTVAERVSDIYDLLSNPSSANSHLLIRASHNRAVQTLECSAPDDQRLLEAIHNCPAIGQLTIQVHPPAEQEAREATLTVRSTSRVIQPPKGHLNYQQLFPITIQVRQATEHHPPSGIKPVSWLLLTTLPITGFTSAVQCLRRYSDRWLIERYHYVLKSGCHLEQLQLKTADRIERALATYTIVAIALVMAHLSSSSQSKCDR